MLKKNYQKCYLLAVEFARSDDQGVHGACLQCNSVAVTGALNTLRTNSNAQKPLKPFRTILFPIVAQCPIQCRSQKERGRQFTFKTACAQPDNCPHLCNFIAVNREKIYCKSQTFSLWTKKICFYKTRNIIETRIFYVVIIKFSFINSLQSF